MPFVKNLVILSNQTLLRLKVGGVLLNLVDWINTKTTILIVEGKNQKVLFTLLLCLQNGTTVLLQRQYLYSTIFAASWGDGPALEKTVSAQC